MSDIISRFTAHFYLLPGKECEQFLLPILAVCTLTDFASHSANNNNEKTSTKGTVEFAELQYTCYPSGNNAFFNI